VLKGFIDTKASQSDLDALSDKVDNIGIFGMSYTIDAFNGYSKPTQITFEDGVIATLDWFPGGGMLKKITASTGEVMTINYDENDRIIGRTITR
jgi:YD repeat-containing protein